jgi:hypothetical protein
MITFKEFIKEASVGDNIDIKIIDMNEVVSIVKQHCSQYVSNLPSNLIFRNMKDVKVRDKCGLVNTENTERKSENTTNYYTIFLDNNPLCKGFPKRSKSLICSSDFYNSFLGDKVVVIPFDNAKIGLTNKPDIWSVNIHIFGSRMLGLDDLNSIFSSDLEIPCDLKDFQEFDERLEKGDKAALEIFKYAFNMDNSDLKEYKDHFMDDIWQAYSPESTGFEATTGATINNLRKQELWVEGKMLVISVYQFEEFITALKEAGLIESTKKIII